jgi:HK97 family phage major capsid protein/HK97 family phage prohead protease
MATVADDLTRPAGDKPPRENLIRAMPRGYELRESDDGMPTMFGHFLRFDEWTEIDSFWEGRFMERIAKGAAKKTIRENRAQMRVLFNHGSDPSIGDKVLGPIEDLREDDEGAYYEVPLFDTAYNHDLEPGLRSGQYGASFRFRVMREEFQEKPGVSDHNPEGLPERTIKELQVMEFGPVTFPAYQGATAGVRSLTDEYIVGRFVTEPKRLRELIEQHVPDRTAAGATTVEAPSDDPTPADATSDQERREETAIPKPDTPGHDSEEKQVQTEEMNQYRTKEEKATQIGVLKSEIAQIAEEHSGKLPADVQARWDEANSDLDELEEALKEQEKREQRVKELSGNPRNVEEGTPSAKSFETIRKTTDPYDRSAVYRDARSPEDANEKFKENAKRALEITAFPHVRNKGDARTHVEKLLDTIDGPGENKVAGELARRILVTGSPAYRRAFGKALAAGNWAAPMTNEERAVMAEGAGATGGFAITFDLDPTIVPTSNGAVNPYRRVCRTVQIAGTNEWRGVSSGAVVATYELEAAEAVDRSPTLAQPAFVTKRAQTFVPFSIELGQDWGALQSELAPLIQDSKDVLEATQFATGVGTTVFPQGMTVGATNTATTGTTTVLAVNDIYKTEEALPPRFRAQAQWFANRFIYNKVRQLDTAGGANLWVQDLRTGIPANETGNTGFNLIGYPANEASAMAASLATTTKIAVLGDPNMYVIVERVGLDIELIPHLFGATAHYPTGQRALYAMWRNTARVFDPAGFITLVGL